MNEEVAPVLAGLFSELVNGANTPGGAFILNSGDIGLLRSLDGLSAAEASRSVQDGATVAAHAQHLRYGLSLMNQWITDGGNPFANAKWDDAWTITSVDDARWSEIRTGLRTEAERWLRTLGSPRPTKPVELSGIVGSIAHLAYHLGAMRQIARSIRGPKEGTFK